MKRLDTFNDKHSYTYFMPDDTMVNITNTGISFYLLLENTETILWLPLGWVYVWVDMLETKNI